MQCLKNILVLIKSTNGEIKVCILSKTSKDVVSTCKIKPNLTCSFYQLQLSNRFIYQHICQVEYLPELELVSLLQLCLHILYILNSFAQFQHTSNLHRNPRDNLITEIVNLNPNIKECIVTNSICSVNLFIPTCVPYFK